MAKLPRIQLSDLNPRSGGKPLARGGRGVIYQVSPKRKLSDQILQDGKYLLKKQRYSNATVNSDSIADHLDEIHKRLQGKFSYFRSRLALPLAIVEDKGKFLGYLMPEFDEGCYFNKTLFSAEVTQALQEVKIQLNSQSERKALSVPEISTSTRFAILVDVLETITQLHECGLVVGDISGSNLIIQDKATRKHSQRVIILDVDSFSYQGGKHPFGAESTIHWRSPEELKKPDYAPTKSSDVYKIGLLIRRILHQNLNSGTGSFDIYKSKVANKVLKELGGVEMANLVARALSVDRNERPKAMHLAFQMRKTYESQIEKSNNIETR